MSTPRVLVAGIGNIFLGDDAFGVEVAQRLLRRPRPHGVQVSDFGIRAIDLTYALLESWDCVVLIDAMRCGHAPGTLFLLEPRVEDTDVRASASLDGHTMNPLAVLRAARSMGAPCRRILLVGCEPGSQCTEDEMSMTMSAPVAAAIEGAIEMAESLVARILRGELEDSTCLQEIAS